jgi:ATP-binding protein involved in chromosome partitioning
MVERIERQYLQSRAQAQAQARRQPKLRVPPARYTIAVGSGKGGVGKSTVAVNLALGLVQAGYRTGLLDADVHGPNVPLMLGVRRTSAVHGWQAMLPVGTNPEQQSSLQLPPLERYGLKMMSIGLLVGEEQAALTGNVALAGLLVRQLLTGVAWGELDILVIDLPPGTGEPQATLLDTVELDGALLVVTPQDVAALDTTRALRAFQAANVPVLGVVENMSYLICPGCNQRIQVFHRGTVPRAITDGQAPLLAEIPLEPALSEAADTGRPLLITAPDSDSAQRFRALAIEIGKRLVK